jgi:hypothetical protein
VVRQESGFVFSDLPHHAGWIRPDFIQPCVYDPCRDSPEAMMLFGKVTGLPEHEFWPDDIPLADAFGSPLLLGSSCLSGCFSKPQAVV